MICDECFYRCHKSAKNDWKAGDAGDVWFAPPMLSFLSLALIISRCERMADLTYPMALQTSLDSLHTAVVSVETYLRAWEWDGRLAKSENRLKDLPAGTPVEILRKADRNFSRLFYSMESYTFFLQDAVNELEKSPLGKAEKQKAYASLYETAKRLQNTISEIRDGAGAEGGQQERHAGFFTHLDWTLSQELTAPAQRKYPGQYTLFSPQPPAMHKFSHFVSS